MRIGFIVESFCCDLRVRKYRAVVLRHIESATIRGPETGGDLGHTMKLEIVYIQCSSNLKKESEKYFSIEDYKSFIKIFTCNYVNHNMIESFFIYSMLNTNEANRDATKVEVIDQDYNVRSWEILSGFMQIDRKSVV